MVTHSTAREHFSIHYIMWSQVKVWPAGEEDETAGRSGEGFATKKCIRVKLSNGNKTSPVVVKF